jgi:hypothetical protein
MGIIDKLKNLRPAKDPMTSGAAKAAAGRSDLADAAGKLDKLRGGNVKASDPGAPRTDKMQNIANAGRDAGMFNLGDGTDIVGNSDSYRSSK